MPLKPTLLAVLALVACEPRPPLPIDGAPVDPDLRVSVRVATWNVEGVGTPGSTEFEATVAIIERLDADVLGINEVDAGEDAALYELASLTGYPHVVLPSTNPFGTLRNAVFTRLPVVEEVIWTSPELSADPSAKDMTRLPISITVDAGPATASVVVQHWKAGFDSIDYFRRAIEGIRAVDALDQAPGDHRLLVGDMNHEVDEGPGNPAVATSVPGGAPSSFWLGSDLYGRMTSQGIETDPFVPIHDLGLDVLDALQADGRPATRDVSGRRIDYISADPSVTANLVGTLVYDSRDDDERVALSLGGQRPERSASTDASDHFPVLVEFLVGPP